MNCPHGIDTAKHECTICQIEELRSLRSRLATEENKTRHLEATNAALTERVGKLADTLREITLGCGPYSLDPLTHAGNTIEAMKELARAALATTEASNA